MQIDRFIKQFSERNEILLPQVKTLLTDLVNPLCERILPVFLAWQLLQSKSSDKNNATPFVVGINGAQGSGKSTVAELIQFQLEQAHNLKSVTLSIDDFYKTESERAQMANSIHPLFASRGVPGTHDVNLCIETIKRLPKSSKKLPTKVPRFNKATDQRMVRELWSKIVAPPDIVILEGWCVGSTAQTEDSLMHPVNQFEASEDFECRWRKSVNHFLAKDYPALFSLIHYLVFLQAPAFESVHQWRLEQEQKLEKKLLQSNAGNLKLMTDKQIWRFIQHFERLTRHNLKTLPQQADCIIRLNEHRAIIEIVDRNEPE